MEPVTITNVRGIWSAYSYISLRKDTHRIRLTVGDSREWIHNCCCYFSINGLIQTGIICQPGLAIYYKRSQRYTVKL